MRPNPALKRDARKAARPLAMRSAASVSPLLLEFGVVHPPLNKLSGGVQPCHGLVVANCGAQHYPGNTAQLHQRVSCISYRVQAAGVQIVLHVLLRQFFGLLLRNHISPLRASAAQHCGQRDLRYAQSRYRQR